MADPRGTNSDENEKHLIDELASIIMRKTKFDLPKHTPGEKQDYSNLDDNFEKIYDMLFKTDSKFNTYAIKLQAINQVYNKITIDKSLVIGQHEYASVDKFFGKDESLTKRQIDAINILKRVYLKLALSIIWNAVDPNNSEEFAKLVLKGVAILNDDLNNERSLVNCKTSEGSLFSQFESKSKETASHIKLKDWLSTKALLREVEVKKDAPSPKPYSGHDKL
jgi:hypothetical protein